MQHDLSTMTPATQAVFNALHHLGQGNVHELANQSGKARSTVDKAIKTLSDAGLIVPVDTDADAAEGVPTRWTMAEGVTEAVTSDEADPDLGQENDINDTGLTGDTEADTTPDLGAGETGDNLADDPQPGTQLDGGDSTGQDSDHEDQDDDEGTESDQDTDDEDDDQDSDDEGDDESEGQPVRAAVTVVQQSRPGDRKVMTIKAVIAEYGDDGATLDEIVNESGIGHPTASRLLAAMEQADAARRLPGIPRRWIVGPTKASEVDPNPEPPRCPVCFQVVKGVTESPEAVALVQSLIRSDGTIHVVAEDGTGHVVKLPKRLPPRTASTATAGAVRRTDLTVNGDGSQPFAKGELEKLTLAVLAANPGRSMSPQEIATTISAQLGGRNVSSGAVRNNCTKAAAKGDIEMVSDAPLTFAYPAPAGEGETAEAETSNATAQAGATAETVDAEASNTTAENSSGNERS
ncbi:MarR family transcriptional regulator [Micromonospora aurantiaca]|uniref:MarR family transcriptional regulator n=1 Tax=Micromonospora aurantiaca (nom. illeg.) TaxID=47850 RepID=UPI00197B194C|nr:helix-turn-helix domain-containing protein [Micromonospora aurantiaca]